jgi:ribosomal RNA-processing protein 8
MSPFSLCIKNTNSKVSNLSFLHKKYNMLNSYQLHCVFQDDPFLWYNYHRILRHNYTLMCRSSLPHNIIIRELVSLSYKKKQLIVDMGCGDAVINQYFIKKKYDNFYFFNYDHMVLNRGRKVHIMIANISDLPICDLTMNVTILCMAMWGMDCLSYIKEAFRVLKKDGTLFIIEPTIRWSRVNTFHRIINGTEGVLLKHILQEVGFTIINQKINAYCFYTCKKL